MDDINFSWYIWYAFCPISWYIWYIWYVCPEIPWDSLRNGTVCCRVVSVLAIPWNPHLRWSDVRQVPWKSSWSKRHQETTRGSDICRWRNPAIEKGLEIWSLIWHKISVDITSIEFVFSFACQMFRENKLGHLKSETKAFPDLKGQLWDFW